MLKKKEFKPSSLISYCTNFLNNANTCKRLKLDMLNKAFKEKDLSEKQIKDIEAVCDSGVVKIQSKHPTD